MHVTVPIPVKFTKPSGGRVGALPSLNVQELGHFAVEHLQGSGT
jgi:hypothetical protein